MIIYKCTCGSQFIVTDNTERTRDAKREWKQQHRRDKRNPGHGYARLVARRGFQ